MLKQLIEALHKPLILNDRVLGGRGAISKASFNSTGPVIIKHYRRGGLLRYAVNKWYLRWGSVRPQIEYELLKHVRDIGISAPAPLAFIFRGKIFYKGWLVTKAITDEKSLGEISLNNHEHARSLMPQVAKQISLLIENKICHIDLHPGNVLVDSNSRIYLIDFDKAYKFKGRRNTLRDYYLCRWRRAVLKHELPDMLAELLCPGIRKNYDQSVVL